MILELSSDELVLAIIGIVRTINPAMLKAEGDGFTVDFTSLQGKMEFTANETLLMKLRTAAESEAGGSVNLEATEARQLSSSLERLEKLQNWSADVIDISRAVRSKLSTIV